MHRIDNATRAIDANGAGKDGFTGGDPDAMIAATVLPADFMNALQEELANIAEKASPLRKSNSAQLLHAINWGLSLTNAWTIEERLDVGVAFNDITSDDESTVVVISGVASPATRIWCARDAWTLAPITPTFAQALRAVAWAPGPRLFVAVGTSGCILTSPDGITWTARTVDASYAGTFFEIACSPTRIVLFGDSDEVQTSEDGITWTHRAVPSSHGVIAKNALSSTAWSDAAACFVATRGPALLVSPDGITWTAGAAPPSATMAVTDSPYGFLAGQDAADALWLSLDGLTWVASPMPGGFDSVYPGQGGFLLGAQVSGTISARIASGPGQRGRAFLGAMGLFLIIRLRFCWATIGVSKVFLSRPFPKLG